MITMSMEVTLGPGVTLYENPAASRFAPVSDNVCDSFATSLNHTYVLQESISDFRYTRPSRLYFFADVNPDYPANTQALAFQLALFGSGSINATLRPFGSSQIQLPPTVLTCGPFTAQERRTCNPAKSRDLSGDQKVNIVDVVLVLDDWGQCPAGGACSRADFDCNGVVDLFDMALLLLDWSKK